jgi:hypothetical protein
MTSVGLADQAMCAVAAKSVFLKDMVQTNEHMNEQRGTDSMICLCASQNSLQVPIMAAEGAWALEQPRAARIKFCKVATTERFVRKRRRSD